MLRRRRYGRRSQRGGARGRAGAGTTVGGVEEAWARAGHGAGVRAPSTTRRRRHAQAPVLHDAHVVQQKTYLSLERRLCRLTRVVERERAVRGRKRGRRRRNVRSELALEQGDLPLQRGDARLLRLEHGGESGARAATRQPGSRECALQLHLQRPQRVRRRLELLPAARRGQRRRRRLPRRRDDADAAPPTILNGSPSKNDHCSTECPDRSHALR